VIFDCFAFYNELEILDIRLHELAPIVDKFVIVEASKTFQGKPKPFNYEQNKERFKAFHDKIIYVPFDFPDILNNEFARKYDQIWAREYHQRDQISLGLETASFDDLIIVSDIDEIPSAKKLEEALSRRRRHDLTVFTMPNYVHFVNRRQKRKKAWHHGPRMTEFSQFTTGQKLRMTKLHASHRLANTALGQLHTRMWNAFNCGISGRVVEITDGGWHLSSIGNWDYFREKLGAFSHAELMQTAAFKSESSFFDKVRHSTFEVDFSELPRFVQENRERYALFTDEAELRAPAA
jgi:beta-1,4-mannosyl-glycoprotein beta-1,4-N-acetylglucosaminyltransferase